MKRGLVIGLGLALLVLGALWLLRRPQGSEQVPLEEAAAAPAPTPAQASLAEPLLLAVIPTRPRPKPAPFPTTITSLPIVEESLKLHSAQSSPEEDLQILQSLFEAYRRALSGAPSGENAEIAAALRGANALGIAVLATNHPALRADGQLLDRWGTPYFFHSLSRERLEIISAGPDRTLWTSDDLREGPSSGQ